MHKCVKCGHNRFIHRFTIISPCIADKDWFECANCGERVSEEHYDLVELVQEV